MQWAPVVGGARDTVTRGYGGVGRSDGHWKWRCTDPGAASNEAGGPGGNKLVGRVGGKGASYGSIDGELRRGSIDGTRRRAGQHHQIMAQRRAPAYGGVIGVPTMTGCAEVGREEGCLLAAIVNWPTSVCVPRR